MDRRIAKALKIRRYNNNGDVIFNFTSNPNDSVGHREQMYKTGHRGRRWDDVDKDNGELNNYFLGKDDYLRPITRTYTQNLIDAYGMPDSRQTRVGLAAAKRTDALNYVTKLAEWDNLMQGNNDDDDLRTESSGNESDSSNEFDPVGRVEDDDTLPAYIVAHDDETVRRRGSMVTGREIKRCCTIL